MRHLLLDEIVKATGGKVICRGLSEFTGLSIDSRTIGEGELFVALKGERFDGHSYLGDALKKGAGAVIAREPEGVIDGKTLVCVGDTLLALQNIAGHIRLGKAVPVVGVTGTNGKTTTKELLAAILGLKHKVLKTPGNLNNHIGVPLSMCRMDGDETVMVIEMGSNGEGDVRLLCGIARPDFAVITNVGPAHLEGFGSLEMVRQTDLEILEYAKTVSVNADDLFLLDGMKGYDGRVLTFGIERKADVSARDIVPGERGSDFTIGFPDGGEIRVGIAVSGRFNIYNALAAASAADALGMERGDIKRGLESFRGVPMRLEVRELSGAIVIRDVYNANPASMGEALGELLRLKKQRAIAVLGDMLELGRHAESEHRGLVRKLSASGVDVLIAVGEEMKKASSEFQGICYKADNSAAAAIVLAELLAQGDTVLIKGSRGMRMEQVLPEGWPGPGREAEHAV